MIGRGDAAALAAHVVRALAEHRRWCRTNAVPFPALLDELLAVLVAGGGHTVPVLAFDPPELDPLLVGLDTAARALGVSVRTVRRLTAAGRLPVVRLGGRALVRRVDLAVFVDELRGAHAPSEGHTGRRGGGEDRPG